MLAANTYPTDYVDACRARIDDQLAAYRALPATARAGVFARDFFANLVLVLELSFVHRTRGREGKDGNPCNEVRLLAESILEHNGVFRTQSSIKWRPEASVLGFAAGDPVVLDEAGFTQLAAAYFDDIARKFT
jgi:hypothetical protein